MISKCVFYLIYMINPFVERLLVSASGLSTKITSLSTKITHCSTKITHCSTKISGLSTKITHCSTPLRKSRFFCRILIRHPPSSSALLAKIPDFIGIFML